MRRIILYCLMALCANQAIAQYSGKGSGTTEDPYLLTTALNVEEIRNFQGVEGIVFRLENDIDMSELIEDTYGYAGWNPLPDFRGELDGNGFTISGLFINRSSVENVGFFSDMNGANIHDLTLVYSGDIIGSFCVGGLCGSASGKNIIERCLIRGNKISGTGVVGGLLGGIGETTVNECIVESYLIRGGTCGGLIGSSSVSPVSNNIVKANISDYSTGNIVHAWGGIVGSAGSGTINNNLFEGKIHTFGDLSGINRYYSIGGIAGSGNSSGPIFSNVVICDSIIVNETYYYGRIAGESLSRLSDPTATNANRAYNKMVLKCGNNCSYATDSKQNGLSVGDILLKSVNMYKSMGWDMENVWTIDDGYSYPRLKWEVEKDLANPPFTITSQDKPINEKEVLSFLAEKVTASIGGGVTYTYYQCVPDEPLITNSSSHPQQVTVTVTSEDYSHLKWAGINGQDGDMTESTESRSCQLERGASIPLKLHAVFADQDFVSYTATIRVSCEQYARTFTIVFTNENPDKPVCPMPTIDYADGKLLFNCEVEGTPEYHVTITNPDVNTHHTVDGELELERTYTIEVYATVEGYQASESAKLILCWIDTKIIDGVYDLKKEEGVPVQIRVNNGIVSVSGVAKDTLVAAYTLEGILLDSTTSSSESVTLNIPASTNVFILKIGNKSVKITL